MKQKLKKILVLYFFTGVMLVFTINVNAGSTKVTFADAYLFFEIWQGTGTSVVSIGDDFLTKDFDVAKINEFEELQYNGKAIDISDYEVTESKGNVIIALKEEYLKTLKDGAYSFSAVFSRAIIPLKLHIVTYKVVLADAWFAFNTWTGTGSAQVDLTPNTFSYTFYPELFNELQYKGNKVDASNYSISQFGNVTRIVLKEEYLKTLGEGEHYFTADFMNISISLKLKKEITTTAVKKPAKVKNIKVVSKKKKLKISWGKLKNVTGYVIKIGTNKKITKNKKTLTIKKNKNAISVKGLKANKKYYFKVRAYTKINGKKYWGKWSVKKSKRTR